MDYAHTHSQSLTKASTLRHRCAHKQAKKDSLFRGLLAWTRASEAKTMKLYPMDDDRSVPKPTTIKQPASRQPYGQPPLNDNAPPFLPASRPATCSFAKGRTHQTRPGWAAFVTIPHDQTLPEQPTQHPFHPHTACHATNSVCQERHTNRGASSVCTKTPGRSCCDKNKDPPANQPSKEPASQPQLGVPHQPMIEYWARLVNKPNRCSKPTHSWDWGHLTSSCHAGVSDV